MIFQFSSRHHWCISLTSSNRVDNMQLGIIQRFQAYYNYVVSERTYASIGARTHHTKSSPIFRSCIHAPYALATAFFASLSRPALQRPRFGVNGLGMSRATILESGLVIRCESFELQRYFSVEFSNAHQTKIHTEMKLLKTYLAAVAIVCEFGLFGC